MYILQCVVCGAGFERKFWHKGMIPMCSEPCKLERRRIRQKVVTVPCVECGVPVECRGKKLYMGQRGRAYCCPEHAKAVHLRTVAENGRKHNTATSVQRMTTNNPMKNLASRQKMSQTLKAMGHHPAQGGNGKPLPVPHKMIADALNWPTEVVISTGLGYPRCYKVDVGNASMKIAIEIDGLSHRSLIRQEQDRRKDGFLRGSGWKVLRFSNQQVLSSLETCLELVRSTILESKNTTTISPMES